MKKNLLSLGLLAASFSMAADEAVLNDVDQEAQLIERLSACSDTACQFEILSACPQLARSIVTILAVYEDAGVDVRARDEIKRLLVDLAYYLQSTDCVEKEVVSDYIAQISSITNSFDGFQASMRLSLGFSDEIEKQEAIRLHELDGVVALLCICRREDYASEQWLEHTAEVIELLRALENSDHNLELDDLIGKLVAALNDRN